VGKWSHLKNDLERAPVDRSWQEKVNEFKADIPRDRASLTAAYNAVRDLKEDVEDFLKSLNTEEAAIVQLLVDDLETDGLTQIRTGDGTSFSLKDDVYTSVEDRAAFMAWIKENGLEDILSVHYQTMNGMVKERFENAQPLPPGLKAFYKTGILRRKPQRRS
jgi:hypothetical protein